MKVSDIHGEVGCVLGVDVSSGLGPVLFIVVWAHKECGGSVMMCRVFGAQLPSSQLPAAARVDTMPHMGSRLSNGDSLGYLTCVIYCRMFPAERSENSTQKNKRKNRDHTTCSI